MRLGGLGGCGGDWGAERWNRVPGGLLSSVLGGCPLGGFGVIWGPRGVPGSGSHLALMAVLPGLMTREGG